MVNDWQYLSLREAGVILIDCLHKTPPSAKLGYPYIAIPQIKQGRINIEGARLISKEHFLEWNKKNKPESYDVILSRRCNPGETAFVPPGLECTLGQNLVLLRSNGNKIFQPYLRWAVQGPDWWEQIQTFLNVGAVFDSLKCADIPNFIIPVPPLPEQRAIAHILGTLDDKIELNRRMNETLEAMAQALFKSWFVDFDPVRAKMEGRPTGLPKEIEDLFPDSFEDSELGEIPRGWEVVPLSKFSEIKGGKQLSKEMIYPSGQIPVFGGAGVMGYTHSFNAEGFIISFGRVGAYCGQFFYHRGKAWINNNASLVLFDRSMPGEWLFLVLKNLELEPIKRGAAQPFISNSDLSALNILMPSFDLIISFQRILFPMFKKLEANLMENNLLCECREKLLPKLLSGEIRVTHLEKILERNL